jgi:hypothetical protein
MDSPQVSVHAENASVGDDGILPSGSITAAGDGEIRRIRPVPREVGVLLIAAGIGGVLLPGPVGTPFLILGGVILWPKPFERAKLFFQKRFPKLHHHGVRQIQRFLDDLERRYPLSR